MMSCGDCLPEDEEDSLNLLVRSADSWGCIEWSLIGLSCLLGCTIIGIPACVCGIKALEVRRDPRRIVQDMLERAERRDGRQGTLDRIKERIRDHADKFISKAEVDNGWKNSSLQFLSDLTSRESIQIYNALIGGAILWYAEGAWGSRVYITEDHSNINVLHLLVQWHDRIKTILHDRRERKVAFLLVRNMLSDTLNEYPELLRETAVIDTNWLKAGETPLDFARRLNYQKLIDLLMTGEERLTANEAQAVCQNDEQLSACLEFIGARVFEAAVKKTDFTFRVACDTPENREMFRRNFVAACESQKSRLFNFAKRERNEIDLDQLNEIKVELAMSLKRESLYISFDDKTGKAGFDGEELRSMIAFYIYKKNKEKQKERLDVLRHYQSAMFSPQSIPRASPQSRNDAPQSSGISPSTVGKVVETVLSFV